MIKATFLVREDPALLNNAIFSGDPLYGMKSDNYMSIDLKKVLAEQDIDLATQDIHPLNESTLVISLDQVTNLQDYKKPDNQLLYLVLSEPSTYCPDNFNRAYHRIFDKIFTYDYTNVDNKKYFHYTFPIDFASYPAFTTVSEAEFIKRKLCILVASAFSTEPVPVNSGSLLHERYLTLKWFSDHQPSKLDLYGRSVDSRMFQNTLGSSSQAKAARRLLPIGLIKKLIPAFLLKRLNRHGEQHRQVFSKMSRGSIPAESKISYLRQYKFSLAYENTGDTPGYITEKIFDCFAAAVVPIYLGSEPVELVPAECFINRRDFRTHEELYNYIKGINYERYRMYVEAIKQFLSSSKYINFTSPVIASKIAAVILSDVKISKHSVNG
jgi:hypothetical protein